MDWARVDFNWPTIEPTTKGSFNWTTYDTLNITAKAQGIKLLPNLSYCPLWANEAASVFYPPIDVQDYADFCTAVAARYYPDITHFELWNEPNISHFWAPSPDAGAYALLLKAGYDAIKAVNSNAVVLMGGLAPTGVSNLQSFIQTIYNTSGNCFDMGNFHPYGWNQSEISAFRQKMIDNGDTSKKIWFTEFGRPTSGTEGQDFDSEEEQAIILSTAIQKARLLSYAGAFFVYEFQDGAGSQPDREGYFGITRSDGSHKLSYDAVKNAM